MTFADDERARVPLALVGVVLLVGSAGAAATLAAHDPAPTTTRTDEAADRALAGANTALAGAARTATANAVRNPVVAAADTRFGAVIDAETAFRDALALRVYARTERAFGEQGAAVGPATASVSLPNIETTADAEAAIEAVSVERVAATVVNVTVSGVEVVARRDGDVLSRSKTNVSVRIHTPALALHDRVQRFERFLDRDALDGPGLDRRLTDYLHRVVWLRGPLQYAGLPISNVLANRHVELMTNRALLGVQQSAFGRADDAGRRAYGQAYARVGLNDVLAVAGDSARRRATQVLERTGAPGTPAKVGVDAAIAATDRPEQSVPVGVNVTADRAFLEFVDSDGETSLNGTLRAAYTAVATRHVDVTRVSQTASRRGTVPENRTPEDTSQTREVQTEITPAAATGALDGERELATHCRRVVVTERERRTYGTGSRERRVVDVTRTEYRVSIRLDFEFQSPARSLPSRRADSVLDAAVERVAPGLRDRIGESATQRLLETPGGVDEIAEAAVSGDVGSRTVVVRPDLPPAIRTRAYRAAVDLRGSARTVSARVSTRDLTNGRVPTDALRSRVDRLHEADSDYATATDRAVAAVRETYLAHVDARLRERTVDTTLADVGEELGKRGLGTSLGPHAQPAAEGVVASVDGAPAYLTLAEVDSGTVDGVEQSYYPLAARNVNWFTVPHGDAADAVVDAALPARPETVRLDTAAQALVAANDARSRTTNETLAAEQSDLREAVAGGVTEAGRVYRDVLAASNVSLSASERSGAVRFALDRWSTVHAQALAVGNGSAAQALAAEAARLAGASPNERDRLETRLRAVTPELAGSESVRVDASLVHRAVKSTRQVGRAVAKNALSEAGAVAAERAAKGLGAAGVGAVPAGLPLAPVPGFWYATTNAWSVSVEGSWAAFTVRAAGASPAGRGDGTAYVREDVTVAFDVDGDGQREFVGRNERLSFEVDVTVGVVVPAGPRGVGDTNGDADEQSSGWG